MDNLSKKSYLLYGADFFFFPIEPLATDAPSSGVFGQRAWLWFTLHHPVIWRGIYEFKGEVLKFTLPLVKASERPYL